MIPVASRRLVAGLGNPGDSYARTRHNVGFRVVERLAAMHAIDGFREECGAGVRSRGEWLICQPLTFMNRSGSSVRCLCERHGLEAGSVLVVYDDIHLPLGRLRMRAAGSAAGHRGLESAIEALQTEAVPRLRLGIGAPPPALGEAGLAEFVLADFLAEEEPIVADMVDRAARSVTIWLELGIDAAMRMANAPESPAVDAPARGLPAQALSE
ncbi:MAG: aminoacyl-tRNA hydrolase [Thermoanaerobaculia bacterium]